MYLTAERNVAFGTSNVQSSDNFFLVRFRTIHNTSLEDMIRKESAAMVKQLLLSEHENHERD